jgi:hypothetical protein
VFLCQGILLRVTRGGPWRKQQGGRTSTRNSMDGKTFMSVWKYSPQGAR